MIIMQKIISKIASVSQIYQFIFFEIFVFFKTTNLNMAKPAITNPKTKTKKERTNNKNEPKTTDTTALKINFLFFDTTGETQFANNTATPYTNNRMQINVSKALSINEGKTQNINPIKK